MLQAGARKAILSYPQVQERKIERLCDLASSYPDAWIATIVSTPFHLDVLATVAARRNSRCARCWIWMPACTVRELDSARMPQSCIGKSTHTSSYSHPDFTCTTDTITLATRFNARRQRSENIESLREFQQQIESAGMPVPCVVAGGSFRLPTTHAPRACTVHRGHLSTGTRALGTAMPDIPFSLRCPDPDPSGGPVSGRGTITTTWDTRESVEIFRSRKGLTCLARTRRNSYCRTKSMESSGSRVNCLVWATISWRCRVTFVPQRSATRHPRD